jgi:phage tail-like protein
MPEAAQKPPAADPAAATARYPLGGYNFKLVIQGVTEGHFTYCTGLGVKVQAIKYREGGANQIVRRLPGRVEYGDVTLRYGLTSSREMWVWLESAAKGQVQRRNVSIVVLGSDGISEGVRFNLIDAWPAAWSGAPLDALGSEVAIEELTLVYEMLERG